ncbi:MULTISPECIES: CBS domain-containing protein [unclassified Modestobacter]|uniref:CBS domain-containing protein n=1 Tax=unclassified Modestobacter TaxID=2643866 RepID=UPI0022AA7651|nr:MULTISPECIES: CBS domain-containing protein [unclassified Modestobacter]MCZ2826223.1 CBS domain-containing protein [Modestobacter sp. VKM Ac-2981]MCZ2852712.1 CBS domain-containing protein [Modestobacter sp. VKM Ac-2982]
MQVRDVMTREVVTVGPDTSAKYAAEVMAEQGFAALPVVDEDGVLIGIVAEADVLRDRLPADPRLHLRRTPVPDAPPALLVRGVMTTSVRTVPVAADVADVARLFVDERLRSAPVLDGERLAGIVSRRDLLRTLVRPDAEIRADVLRLVEGYTQEPGGWDVQVFDGVATVQRAGGVTVDAGDREAVESAVATLARTVPGIVAARVLTDVPGPPGSAAPR